MKVLKTDNTEYIFADKQLVDDSDVSVTNYGRLLENMSDDYPANYTAFDLGSTRIIEVRTSNSEIVGLAGTNAYDIESYIGEGTIHDVNDVVTDGTFQNWTGGVPDDWTVEANADVSEGTESVSIGGYAYTKYLRMVDPNTSSDIAVKQTMAVSSNQKYILTLIGPQQETPSNKFSIYDETNGSYIKSNQSIGSPYYPGLSSAIPDATYYEIFTTPSNCVSITLRLWVIDYVNSRFDFRGVSIRPVTQQTTVTIDNDGGVFSDEDFNTIPIEYTKVVGDHSIFLDATASSSPVKVGCLQTGLLTEYLDPKQGMRQGLRFDSVLTDLKYGGRLIDTKYNKDVFQGSITLSEADANDFMYSLVPTIRRSPRFWILGDISEQYWSVFAKFDTLPVASKNNNITDTITVNLVEAI